MPESNSLTHMWNEFMPTLAAFSQGAFRLLRPDGNLEEGGIDAPICRRQKERNGADFCRRNCWLADRCGDTGGISQCAGQATQIVVPLWFGGQFLGQLFFGDFRGNDEPLPNEQDPVWRDLMFSTGLTVESLREDFVQLRAVSQALLAQQMQSLRKLLDDHLDNLLELRIREVKSFIVDSEKVPREALWRRLEQEIRHVARVEHVEIFTVAPARDSITRECPLETEWDQADRFEDFQEAEAQGYCLDREGRLVIWLQYEGRVLAVFRIRSAVKEGFASGDKEAERLRRLSDGIAEALQLRRHERAERILSALNPRLTATQDHRERLKILLAECLKTLDCQNGEILLRTPGDDHWMKVVVRCGAEHQQLPSRSPARAGLVQRVLRTGNTIVVTDTSCDADFQSQAEVAGLSDIYPENIQRNYKEYLHAIRACVKIPLKVGPEIQGVMCLHRETMGPFYLGLVHVIELVAERVVLELAYVLIAEEFSARAEEQRKLMSPLEELLKLVQGLGHGAARQELCKQLASKAQELSKGYRAAVAVINEEWTRVAVLGCTKGWPTDPFELSIELKDKNSAVAEAIRRGENYLIPDIGEKGVHFFMPENDEAQIGSSVNIRLKCGPNVLGILVVDWGDTNAYDDMMIDALTSLADRYADAMHVFDVHQQMLRLEAFLKEQSFDKPDYQQFLQHAARMIGVGEGALFIRNLDSGLYQLKAHLVKPELVDEPDPTYAIGEGLTGWVIEKNRTLCLRNVWDNEERERLAPRAVWEDKIRDNREAMDRPTSLLATPVSFGAEVIGVLRFNIATKWRPFDIADASLAETIASKLAACLYAYQQGKRNLAELKLLQRTREFSDVSSFAPTVFDAIQTGVGTCGCHIRLLDFIQQGEEERRPILLRVAARQPSWIPAQSVLTSTDDKRAIDAEDQVNKTDADLKVSDDLKWRTPDLFHEQHEHATGWVWCNQEPLYDPDVRAQDSTCARLGTNAWFREYVGSVIVVPLRIDDRFVGTMHVYKERRYAFTTAERQFIEDISRVTASGLTSILEKESAERQQSLRACADSFFRLLICVPDMLSPDEQLARDLLVELLERLHGAQGWFLWPDATGSVFRARAVDGKVVSEVPVISTDLIDGLLGDQGLRLTIGLGEREDVAAWLKSWVPTERLQGYLAKAKEKQACLIAMNSESRVFAVFCILVKVDSVLSYEAVKQVKNVLDNIGREIDLAVSYVKAREAEQRRFEEAAQPLALIGAMASSMEHSLRGPVNYLVKSLEYLTERPRSSIDIQQRLEFMRDLVETLDENVNKLVSVTGNQNGFQPMALMPILQAAIEETSTTTQFEKLFLSAAPSTANLYVAGVAKPLQDAFGFLLKNAVEAVESYNGEGKVTIIADCPSEGRCRITIHDDGAGMDEETRLKAMQPFASTKGAKRGLGLPAAYCLIRCHQGQLDIESEPGRGTNMIVTLPTFDKKEKR